MSGVVAAMAVAAVLLVPACRPVPADDGLVAVVAAFYPLQEAATRVGGDRVSVTNVTPPGAEPHDVEVSSREVDAIQDADVVLYVGHGFQPAVEDLASGRGEAAVDVLEGQDLVEGDPHVWLDPQRMQGIVEAVRDALVEADPDGAATYADDADTYVAALAALDRDVAEGLSRCERDTIVTSHAAFGYLAARYGLTQVSIAGLSPEAEPDPAHLAELADLVEAEGVTTVFSEELLPQDLAETLAREAGVETAVLSPLEGLTRDEIQQGDDYTSVMRENLAALRGALGCR